MSLRKARLADLIRDILATLLSGGQMSDPALGSVAITAVRVSADLQVATAYYRNFGSLPNKDVQAGLQRATGYFRRQIADAIDLRRVPEVRFFFDESIERAARVEELLAQI